MTRAEVIVAAVALLFGFGGTAWLTHTFNLRRPNFRSARIPSVAGLAFVLSGVFFYAYEWRSNTFDPSPALAYFLVVLGFGVLGLVDDLSGDRSVGGFRGHFAALAAGRLTTGAVKALGGAAVSLIAGYILYPHAPGRLLLSAVLIAMSANALNLLDLRPGRCLFAFFVGAAILWVTLWHHQMTGVGFLLYFAVAAAALLYPMDAGGRLMLGDTGSNSFGATLGIAGALFFSPFWQAVIVALLIAFQVWCEKHSLSKTIEANPLLRRLDRGIGVR